LHGVLGKYGSVISIERWVNFFYKKKFDRIFFLNIIDMFYILREKMTKKEYVLKVLEKVKGYWDRAEKIGQYISTHDDEGYLNYLYEKCVVAVDMAIQAKNEDKIKELWNILDKIHEQEAISKKADEEDITKLDQLLENL